MADIGHSLTEDILSDLEERIKEEYAKAVADAEEKLAKWLQKFEKGKLEQKALLDAGKISQQEYKDWLYRHTMMGKQWEDLQKVLAEDFHHANEIALQISRGQMPDVYAVNANYATYQIEHDGKIDTSFTLYNHDTAEILMKNEHVQLMPRPSTKKAAEIAANKDMQWNMRKIQSAVLQGVLQGESPFEVAHRLEQVGQMNYNSAVRYARTMGTSAQNAGRYQAYERATDLGVKLTIEWLATLDGRTRHDHRMMHGQRRKVGEPFETPDGFSILWPADSSSDYTDAPQREIWNCRCTLLSWVEGFEGDTVKHSYKMGSMSFEEWQQENAPKQKPAENVAPEVKPAKNRFGETIKFSNMDDPKWDGVKRVIEDLSSEFETKLKSVERGSGAVDMAAGTTQVSGSVIRLSTAKEQTAIHEFAHSISMQNQTKFGLYDEAEFWKEINKVKRVYMRETENDPRKWISSYEHSSKGSDEFMAEAFTMAIMHEKGINLPKAYGNDLTFADEVLRIIRKYFGK